MPYKISGTLSDAARIIIIKESDWSIESNTTESVGAYEVDSLEAGAKLIAARKSDGEALVYGSATPIEYTPPGRGVFGGGWTDAAVNMIDYITISSLGDATDFGDLSVVKRIFSATSNGTNDRGIFGGGYLTPAAYTNVIEYITISTPGNTTDFGDLTSGRNYLDATSNSTNDRGVFGGGQASSNVMEYITISSTGNATDFGDLTIGRYGLSATSNGTSDRGVFGGGTAALKNKTIDYITISSTGDATDFGDLTDDKDNLAATSNGTSNRGVFGGGNDGASTNIIDYITISSTGNATDFGDLTLARNAPAATSNGTSDRGVFGGGTVTNIIDYITISSAGNATDFGDLTAARYSLAATSNA